METKQNQNSSSRKVNFKQNLKIRGKLSVRTVWIIAVSAIVLMTSGVVIFLNLTDSKNAFAVANGDYRTKTSGNWNATSTWEKYNGSSWVAAASTPSSANGVITILSGHTVTVTSAVTVDQVVISSGGQVTLNSGVTLTINAGAGTDLDVTGIFKSAGTVTINAGATIAFQSGGKYQHNFTTTAGTIPTATWNTGSTCEIIGYTTNTAAPSGLQSFYNFIWNCASQTANVNLAGGLTTINGDFTVANTNTASLWLTNITTYTLNIAGNWNVGSGASTASLDLEAGGASCNVNVTGNISIGTAGTIERSGTSVAPVITFKKASGIQTFYSANAVGISSNGRFDWNVGTGSTTNTLQLLSNFTMENNANMPNGLTVASGSILDADTFLVSGPSATFDLNSGAGILTSNASGLAATAATGSIRVTGTRTYSTGADYTFDGSVAQITGDGVPSTVHNLTINNSAGNVTLTNTTSISNTLTFTSGNVIATADTLVLGTSTSVLGTLTRTSGHVVGYFKRWLAASVTSNILFPLGTINNYNGANVSFTVAPTTAGSIVSTFVQTNPGITGLPITDASDNCVNVGNGYWSFTAANSFAGGTYSLNLNANGFPGISDYTKLHIFYRTGAGSSWTANGTHAAGTGSLAAPVANRTLMTSLGQIGIVSPSVNPLPIELIYFNAKLNGEQVDLSWATASEMNNDHFTVERSEDGIHFSELLKKPGAGNSTVTLYYKDVDKNPLAGTSYYRLKQTDYDGHFTHSEIKIIKINSKLISQPDLQIISIAPNPFTEKFTATFKLKSAIPVVVQLINAGGQVISDETIGATEGINEYNFTDKKGLLPGIYFLNLLYNDQKSSLKLIKK